MRRLMIVSFAVGVVLVAVILWRYQLTQVQNRDSYRLRRSWTGYPSDDGRFIVMVDDETRTLISVTYQGENRETSLLKDFRVPERVALVQVALGSASVTNKVSVVLHCDGHKKYQLLVANGKGKVVPMREDVDEGINLDVNTGNNTQSN